MWWKTRQVRVFRAFRCCFHGRGVLGASLLTVTTLAAAADHGFSVAAQPIATAVQELAREAHFQLVAITDDLPAVNSNAINDEPDVKRALKKMLAGTGVPFSVDVAKRIISIPHRSARVRPASPREPEAMARDAGSDQTAQVVVTGTLVHGGKPIAGDVHSIGSDEIDAFVGSPADLLNTIPQVFRGGPSEVLGAAGAEALTNSGLGAGVNVRGLGAGATLVLIDGHRLAPSGSNGEFVDPVNLPRFATAHIDILTGGASAVYGSDAVGGVVNFVLRDGGFGTRSFVEEGSVTSGALRQSRLSQSWGGTWDSGNGIVTFERITQTALAASDRRFETSDLRGFGGPNLDGPFANPGTILAGGTTWAIPHGQNGPLAIRQLQPNTVNLQDLYFDAHVLPEREQTSGLGRLHQEFNEVCVLDLEGFSSRRVTTQQDSPVGTALVVPSTNPYYYNPAGGNDPVTVNYSFGPELGPQLATATVDVSQVAVDLEVSPGKTFHFTLSVDYATDTEHQTAQGKLNVAAVDEALASKDPQVAFDPFRDGSFTSPIAQSPWFSSQSRIFDVMLKVEGTLVSLPGGPLVGALGEEFRDEMLATAWAQDVGLSATTNRYRRGLQASFAQLEFPFFGAEATYPGLRELNVSLAASRERNSDFGRTLVPLLRLQYSPVSVLHFVASWNRSFEAPPLPDLNESRNTSVITPMPDPLSPTGSSNVLVASGSRSGLSEQRAVTRSFGAGFSVPAPSADAATTASLELTYFDSRFTGRIDSQPFSATALSDPAYVSAVVRNPSQALRSQICVPGQFFGDLSTCENAVVGAILDLRLRNIDSLLTRGIDFHGMLRSQRTWGALIWELNGTQTRRYSEIQAPSLPEVSLLDTIGNPLSRRLRSELRLERRGMDLVAAVNYQNRYHNTQTTPATPIASWTTADIRLRYRFRGASGSLFRGLEFGVSVQNVFDRDPPYALNLSAVSGWDPSNANPFNRVVGAFLQKRW